MKVTLKPRRFSPVVRQGLLTGLTLTLLVSLFLYQANPVHAATFVVNSTLDRSDANPGNGICATSSGECTLRAAIQEANALSGADTIQLPAGVYELAIPTINDDTDGTGDIDIHTPLTIVGVGAAASIIDGGFPLPGASPEARGIDRLFEIHPTAGNVTFKDLTLREGYTTDDGAAIQNWSPGLLRLENVQVRDNLAGGVGGGINNAEPAGYPWAVAPAVPPKSGRVEIVNSTFSGNAAGGAGAAVNNAGSGTVSILANSRIVNNPGQMIPDPLDPAGVIPAPGVYEPGAGAISNQAEFGAVGTIKVADSTISDNYATTDGAGIHNAGFGTISVERSTIAGNTTEAEGGGLYTHGGTVTVLDSTVSDNHAHDGAGIYSGGAVNNVGLRSRFTVTGSSIEGNVALASGGGIANGGDAQLILTDVTIVDNKAGDAGAGLENGGLASMEVTRVTFSGNIANGEGGGAWTGSERLVTIRDSEFINNQAGAPTPDDLIDPASANTAGGGGLYAENGPATITGSTFDGNSATAEGGGLSIDSFGDVTISDSTVRNNRAGTDGGGIENSGTRVTFERLLVTNNYATVDGGGIHNSSSGPFTIVDTTVQLNSAVSGGGLANAPDNALIVRRSLFLRNTARNPGLNEDGTVADGGHGGGIYSLADGDSLIENTTISGNTAGVGGGGLFHDADGELKLVNLTIWRNSAPIGGGVGVVESDFVPESPPQPNHSVIARNTIIGGSLQGGSCDWYLTTEGGNIDTGSTCFLSAAPNSDILPAEGRDWRSPAFAVDALADNGGPTLSHALREDSIALDAAAGTCAETDQRGVARPQNSRCDIGAYEYEGDPPAADDVDPDTEFLAGPIQDGLESVAFRFTGSDNLTPVEELQFECRLIETDPAEPPEPLAPWDPIPIELQWVGCSSPWQSPLLEEGLFTFEVRAIDRNGNIDETPAVHTFSGLDTSPPETIIAEKPPLTTGSRAATFTFTGVDNQTPPQFLEFECRLDTNDPELWLECVNPMLYSNLTSGSHTMEVRAIDGGDNVDPTPARYTWTVGQPASTPINCDLANVTLTAVADAWIDEVNPTENYLFYTDLGVHSAAIGDPTAVPPQPIVGQNARALVRFALPSDATGCTLESATLRLYNESPTEGRAMEAVPLAGSWLESTVTWFNQPGAVVTTPATSATSTNPGYQDWDVLEHVEGMIAGGVNHGWLIRDAVESDPDGGDQSFASREAPQDPPEMTLPLLVLRYAADGAPPPPPPSGATTPTEVYCGQVITQTILVANDLNNCAGEGLVIGAPNIVLDLNGHTVDGLDYLINNTTGQEEGFPAGIRNSGHTNVVIRNGTVQQFGWGVLLAPGTTRNIVEELTVLNNAVSGIELFDADDGRNGNTIRNNTVEDNELGVTLVAGSQNSIVRNNTIGGNLGEQIFIQFSDGHLIENNTMHGIPSNPLFDSDGGVLLDGSSNNVILNNTLQDTGDAGFNVSAGSNRNRIEGNVMYRNGDAGVIVQDSHGNQIIDNVSHQQSDGGVVLNNANDTVIRGNDLRFNPSGVEAGGANDLVVEDNDGSESLQAGFELGSGLNMIIRNNVANHTGGAGISLEGAEFDANGNPIGGALIEGNTTNENRESGIAVADGGHTIKDNSANNNAGYGIIAGDPPAPGEPAGGTNIDGGGNRASGNGEVAQCVGVVCDAGTPVPVSTPDITPPDSIIVDGPGAGSGAVSSSTSATFIFTATDNAYPSTALIYECRLDPPPDPTPEPIETPDPEPPDPGATPEPIETPEPVDPGNWGSCISPKHYHGLEQGEHHFEVRARDLAEPPNVELTPATYDWSIDITTEEEGTGTDTLAPNTRITTAPDSTTTSTAATFYFSGSDNLTPGLSLTFQCQIDGQGFTACTAPQSYPGLASGPHTFEVRAVDRALNVDTTPATHTWTIVVPPADTTPPDTTIGSGPDPVTVLTTATFTFSSNETGVIYQCSVDGGATFAACTSPKTYTGLAAGARDFRVRAVDPSGNVDASPASFTWTISPAPVATTVFCGQVLTNSVLLNNDLLDCPWDGLVVGAAGITIDLNGHTIDGVGLAAGIRNDGYDLVTIKNGTVDSYDYGVMLNAGTTGNIVEGMTLQNNQEAGIGLGNVPPPLDPTLPMPDPPPASFQSGVSANILRNNMILANDRGIWLTNRTEGTLIQANLMAANVSDGVWLERSDNNHVEANEISGSSGGAVTLHGARNNTVVDNILAESGTGVYIGATTAGVVGLPSNDNRVEGNSMTEISGDVMEIVESEGNELIGNVAHGANGSGVSLYFGNNNLVHGNDVSGNKNGIALKNSSGNRLEANKTSESEGTGITLEALSLNNDLVDNVSSNNDGDGIYVGDETAGDLGVLIEGNTTNSNVGYGIYVPKVSHTIKDNMANDNGSWGIWVSDGSNGRVNVDGGGNRAQGNLGPLDPFTLKPLQCFSVQCDGGPPLNTDEIAPDTLILQSPPNPSTDTVAAFHFNGSDNASAVTFQCKVDTGDFAPCVSPAEYELASGTHTFDVRAVDAGGVVDPTPATYTWEIIAAPAGAPETIIDSGPDLTTVSMAAAFAFSASERGSTFECALDGAAFAPCTSPKAYSGLAVGAHTFRVRATDQSAETDASPATYSWVIGSAPVAAEVTCGEIIVQSTRLLNDLVDCTGHGLIIGANGITLDLNGHLIDGTGLDAGILNNGYDSVTIRNGTLHEFDYGLLLNPGTSLNVISDLRLELNQESGIALADADQNGQGNTIRDNTLVGNGHGIALLSNTRFALVRNNALGANTGDGVRAEFANDNRIEANEIATSGGSGIALVGGGNNTVVDNSLSANLGFGIAAGEELLPSNGNLIQRNTVNGGQGGISVVSSSDNQVLYNVVSGATGPGVALELAQNTLVRGNDLRSNSSGIALDESSNNRLESNNASGTLGTGIEIGALSYNNVVVQNAANINSGEGIHVVDTAPVGAGNLLDRNTADGNGGDGIAVDGVGHTLTGNRAQINGGWGIYVAAGATDGGGNFAAGNVEPAQCFGIACTLGTVPGTPETWIVSAPPATSNSRNASFTYMGSDTATPLVDLIFECRLDSTNDLAWEECEYPAEYLNLSPGEHVFEVRAVEPSLLADPTPARHVWTYASLPAGVAPETIIDLKPEAETWLLDALFTFHSNEPDVTFECKVDLFGYEPCGFEGATYMSQGAFEWGLEETEVGLHTFSVRAIDFEGNVGEPATYTWRLLGVVTTFTSGPGFTPGETPIDPPTGGPVQETNATITFVANVADATFQCSLDLALFTPCTSPVTYTGLIAGSHELRVFATTAEGLSELEPAIYEWEVIETLDVDPPTTTIERAPANNSSSTIFEFTGVDNATPPPLLTFQCRVDSTNELDWTDCVSPFNLLDLYTYQDTQLAPGQHTFEVRALDMAEPLDPNALQEGNADSTPASHTWTMVADTTPPGTGILAGPAAQSGDPNAEFTFFGSDNATPLLALTYECAVDTGLFAPCSSPESVQGLEPGPHTFRVRAVDLAGNVDASPAERTWTLVPAPVTTITSGPGGRIVDGAPPATPSTLQNAIFIFSANQAGSTFECSLNGADFTSCTSPRAYGLSANGTYEFAVRATNPEGVVEEPPVVYEWLVELGPDTTAPNTTITSQPSNPDTNTVATFTFTGSDNRTPAVDLTFECALDGTAYSSCTRSDQWSDLVRGSHTLLVRARDDAGNFDTSPASYTWTVEPPPVTVILSGPAELTESSDATFTFQADVPGSTFQCWLDGLLEPCTSPMSYTGLAAGEHLFAVLATAPAGTSELAWAEYEWTIGDTSAPITTIESGPARETTSTSATFVFSANEPDATLQCSLDGATPQACTSPREYPRLYPGLHRLEVVAMSQPMTDSLGLPIEPLYEPIPVVYEWTIVDLEAPDTIIQYGPPATTASINAYFGFSTDDPTAIFECSLDGAAYNECTSPADFTDLAVSAHTLAVRAVDLAGNFDPTPANYAWTIVQLAPNTPAGTNVTVNLPLPDGSGTATLTFFEVTLLGVTTLDALNGAPPLPAGYLLAGGRYYDVNTTAEFTEPATLCIPYDPAAFEGSAVRMLHFDGSIWVDVTVTNNPATGLVCGQPESFSPFALVAGSGVAPLASIISGPSNPSTSGSATFSFAADHVGAMVLCSLDGLPFAPCTSPVTYTHLESGDHDFQVQAIGSDGQIQLVPALYEWEVILGPDTTAPDTTITKGPAALTANFISLFEFTGSDDQTLALDLEFECSLDGAVLGSCSSPEEVEVLAAGVHTFTVRALDAAGNFDPTPASRTWTVVDLSAPDTSIDLGPDSETESTSAVFEFSGVDGLTDVPVFEFECSLDNADFAPCTSPYELQNLAPGAHVLQVRAKDLAGVVDPSPDFYEWLIIGAADLTPPDTFIVVRPPADNSGPDVIFGFNSSKPVEGFECSLDGAPFEGCEVVHEVLGLAAGTHTLAARAVDLLGAVDPTPATYSWTTLGEPDTTILSGPSDPSASLSATLVFTSSQAGVTFQCSVDGTPFVSCTSPFIAGPLMEDTHQFEVRAVNQFVNLEGEQVVDQTPAAHEWTIQDITPPNTTILTVTVLGPTDLVEPNSIRFEFAGEDNRTAPFELEFECALDGGLFEGCTTPHYLPFEGLAGGTHELQVRAVDALENVDPSPASYTFSNDGEPETTILSGPAAQVDSVEATFTFSSDQATATFECSLDGAEYAACVSPATFTSVPYGAHELLVRAKALDGTVDPTPSEYAWESGDMTPPVVTILTGPLATTTDITATFTFTSDDASVLFQCSLDGLPLTFCTSGVEYTNLLAGEHTFEVVATKANLLVEAIPAEWIWTVQDPIAPETAIVTGPAAAIALGSPAAFTFSSNEPDATFECALNGEPYAQCATPPENSAEFDGLAVGEYNLLVRAVDPSLNADATPASATWTVVGPPQTTILSGPPVLPDTALTAMATFSFTADQGDVTFQCAIDGFAPEACTAPVTYTNLAAGEHTFEVAATNSLGLGEEPPVSYEWTVDLTVAQNTPTGSNVSVGLPLPTGTGNVTVTFATVTAEGATTVTALSSPPALPGTVLAAGAQYYDVSTTAEYVAPITVCLGYTPGSVTEPVRLLHFEGGAWMDVTTSNDPVAGVVCGEAANLSPFAIVTAAAPVELDTLITSGPPSETVATSANFTFTANDPAATFECSLDQPGDWGSCEPAASFTGLSVGLHELLVRAKDAAGVIDATPADYRWTILPLPETAILTGPEAATESTEATFTFSSDQPGATFECVLDDAPVFVPCESGITYTGLIAEEHDFFVRAKDAAGNVDPTPADYSWEIGEIPPAVTVDSGPGATTESRDAIFVFAAAEPGLTYECALDGAAYAPCTSPKSYSGLPLGAHTFQVRVLSPSAIVEPPIASYTWTVADLSQPETTIDGTPSNPLSGDAAASFSFSAGEANATFECALNEAPFSSCTSPIQFTGLVPGVYTFAVRALDASGNVDATPASYTWAVVAPPETTIDAGPDGTVNATTVTFTLSSDDPAATFECALDGGPYTACITPHEVQGLADGEHTLLARARNTAGIADASPDDWSWTVDLLPETTIVSGPPVTTTSTVATFVLAASEPEVMFECALDGAAFAPCATPFSISGLAIGAHELLVRATDNAGAVDPTPASYTWSVLDGTAPETVIDSGPPATTTSTSATFTFTASEPGVTFECVLDAGPVTSCVSPATYEGLTVGSHVFQVRAIDASGNADPAPASYTWEVQPVPADVTAPDTSFTVLGTPLEMSNSTAATFRFTGSDDITLPTELRYTCRLASVTGVEFVACDSPAMYSGLGEGTHTFEVKAIDAAGNSDATPASFTWTIDVTAPDTTLNSGPAAATAETVATFAFSAIEAVATFECSLDGSGYVACASPQTYSGLGVGVHFIAARATDAAGNVDPIPATYTWTVQPPADTTPPDTTLNTWPAAATTETAATFTFSANEAGATFECSVDGTGYVACASPQTYSSLGVGVHFFAARATDAAGNVDPIPATYTWSVQAPADTTPPDTTLGTGPAATTTDTAASFILSANEAGARFECSLDGSAFATCTSPQAYTGLGVGVHTFAARAIDVAGNVDPTPATYTWTVQAPADTTPPDTMLNSGPAGTTTDTAATFTFSANEAGATFQCSLDGSAYAACASPQAYTGLSVGGHTFAAHATDAAGNTDPTPASYTWTVQAPADTTPPDTTLNTWPAASTTETATTFTFSANEVGATFQCSLDGSAFAACASPQSYTGLGVGVHTFAVRGIDVAGNVDPTPATYTWTTQAPLANCGASITVAASADAWIDHNSRTSNKGTDSILKVQGKSANNNMRALVRFNLPAMLQGCQVGSATLRLFAASSKTGRTLQAIQVAGNWTENGVTWNNQPATTGVAATTTSGSGWRQWNVAAPVQAMYASGANHGFLIRDAVENSGSHEQQYHAREKGQDVPQLVLSFIPVPPPPDTTSPETTIGGSPEASTFSTEATFAFSANEVGSTFACSLDGSAFASCTSPAAFSGLALGPHTFQVQATDAAGNVDLSPASYTWAVVAPPDTTSPETTIGGSPEASTFSTEATFAFSANEVGSTFACSLDGSAFASCTSPAAFSGLALGPHTFQVQATDAAGNVDLSPASYTWAVVAPPDTTSPETTIGGSPEASTFSTEATFAFSANEASATFQCSLDGTGYAACASPQSYTGLSVDGHTFEVRATDAAGNTDPTPASYTWTVEAPAPAPTEEPTAVPTEEPTAVPTEEPTAVPTEEPTAVPTEEPTAVPTEEPTAVPTEEPTAVPTEEPTAVPTEEPTAVPTEEPTAVPTEEPTAVPTEEPTAVPTEEPTAVPTEEPTAVPTEEPTAVPTEEPTAVPTEEPTAVPTEEPTVEGA